MTKSSQLTVVQTEPETATDPSLQTPESGVSAVTAAAIARCQAVYLQTMEDFASIHGPETFNTYPAKKVARVAYRDAMPELSSRENIQAFIGCIANAILLEAIREDTSARLLHAAQVALSSLRFTPKEPKNPKSAEISLPPIMVPQ